MPRKSHNPAVFYENYIPDTLIRPIKDRPKQIDRWSYLEKTRYYKTVWENEKTLEHIKKHGKLPEGMTKKDEKTLKALKLISQREGKLVLHKFIQDMV